MRLGYAFLTLDFFNDLFSKCLISNLEFQGKRDRIMLILESVI